MFKALITEFPLSDVPKGENSHRGEDTEVHLHQRGSRCANF